MKLLLTFSIAAAMLAGCDPITDEDIGRQIAAIGPDSPPSEVIVKRFAAIDPEEVTTVFGYPDICFEGGQDVGLMTAWGRASQTDHEIVMDMQRRAAKFGANYVLYESGVQSVEEYSQFLREHLQYTLMRCH